MDEQKNELLSPEEQTPEEQSPKNTLNPQTSYLIRILIGGYIAYLGWELASGIFAGTLEGTKLIVCAIAAALFAIAGVGLVVWSLWLMMKKP